MSNQDWIRERAYALWEEVKPDGLHEDHWQRADDKMAELVASGRLSVDLDAGAITPNGQPATAPSNEGGASADSK